MNSVTTYLSRLRRRKFVAELLMLGCGTLTFGWIGAALVLILGDEELRQYILRIFWYLSLWLAVVPLCGFAICWSWRSSLTRKISEIESKDAV
jgi:hypothetical protein